MQHILNTTLIDLKQPIAFVSQGCPPGRMCSSHTGSKTPALALMPKVTQSNIGQRWVKRSTNAHTLHPTHDHYETVQSTCPQVSQYATRLYCKAALPLHGGQPQRVVQYPFTVCVPGFQGGWKQDSPSKNTCLHLALRLRCLPEH
jgi:hypothetical protein